MGGSFLDLLQLLCYSLTCKSINLWYFIGRKLSKSVKSIPSGVTNLVVMSGDVIIFTSSR